MTQYIINHSDGSTFNIYDLEENGPNNISTPRQIIDVDITGGAGINFIKVLNDLTYRFILGFQFNIINSGANDGLYTTTSSSFDGIHTTIVITEVITNAGLPFGNIQYSIPISENATSLLLTGRASLNFGESLIENYVHLLENFSNTTSPVNPVVGQLWYKSDTDELYKYDSTLTWSTSINIANGTLSFIDPQHPTDQINPIILISGDDTDVGLSVKTSVDPSSQDSIFRVLSSDNSERLRIEHDGYLSTINSIKSTGSTLLNEFGNSIQLLNNTGIQSAAGAIMNSGLTGMSWEFNSGNPGVDYSIIVNDSTGSLIFGVNTATDIVEIVKDFSVNSTTLYVDTVLNNVGIGKNNPGEKLDVVGNITYSGQLLSSDGTPANPGISFGGNNTVGFRLTGSNIGVSIGGTDKMTFSSNGILFSNTANYETLVIADNDIPNKKYIDDEISAIKISKAKLYFYGFGS